MTTVKFEVGKTYATRSFCDHSCIYRYTVARRSEKCVWVHPDYMPERLVRRMVFVSQHADKLVEKILPHGNYSMAPVLSADQLAEDVRNER